MRLLCWNVNSIMVRLPRLLAALQRHQPDVVCLQETKCVDDNFPGGPLAALGYRAAVHGQKSYNGVAILAKQALEEVYLGFADPAFDAQARFLSARVGGTQVACAYVPNGSQVGSEKFTYKLAWLRRLCRALRQQVAPQQRLVLCGDLNVAPRDSDVAQPAAWAQSVLCHPQARAAFAELLACGLHDSGARQFPDGGVYSWWDYRKGSFGRNDGLRIDHLLCSAGQQARLQNLWVDKDERRLQQHPSKPSDHAPLLADFADA